MPNRKPLSRFQTSDAPHEKTSLGAIWGSETKEDEGHWIRVEAFDEEQILDRIGTKYVPPHKRNFVLIEQERPKKGVSTRAKRKP